MNDIPKGTVINPTEIAQKLRSYIWRYMEMINDHNDLAPDTIKQAEERMETLLEAEKAVNKQIPKKPLQGKEYYWIDTVKHHGRYINARKKAYGHECHSCKKPVAKLSNVYCNHCGQAIDWSEETTANDLPIKPN